MRAIVFLLSSQVKIKHAVYDSSTEFDIDMITLESGNIYIGPKAPNSLSRSRFDTLMFPGEGDQPARPLAFYNVENPEKIVAFFK